MSQCEFTEEKIKRQERINTGTSWTCNKNFERNGYLVIENICDPDQLYHPVPKERGQLNWWGKNMDQFSYQEEEHQVNGSLARYSHPMHTFTHTFTYIHTFTYTHIHIHAHSHTRTFTNMHIHIHTFIHSHAFSLIRTSRHTYLHTCVHTNSLIFIHMHTNTFIHLLTHPHTFTLAYTQTRYLSHTHIFSD